MQIIHRLNLATTLAIIIGCGTLLPLQAHEPHVDEMLRSGVGEETTSTGTKQFYSSEGVSYISGGIGIQERAEFSAVSNQYNLRLLFAQQGSGKYLSSVRVDIRDAQGKLVLSVESDGPWLFAQLPPANYVVEATAPPEFQEQRTQQHKVDISASHQSHLDFYWK